MLPCSLATATDALDLAIESLVFLVHRIVWVAQIFLRGYLVGARLPVTDRGLTTHRVLICAARRSGGTPSSAMRAVAAISLAVTFFIFFIVLLPS
jgi:hypothetical protein